MFERLTASSPRIRSRPYATAFAVGAHVALGLLVVRSTGLALPPRQPAGVIVFDPYVEPHPVTPLKGESAGAGVRGPAADPRVDAPGFTNPGTDALPGPISVPVLPRLGTGALDSLRAVLAAGGKGADVGGESPTSETLDAQPPRLLSMPEPRYPDALRAAGVEGRVEVEFVVGLAGRVDSASIEVRAGSAAPFVAAARAAIMAARFAPARLRGVAVAARARQAVVFRITTGG